MIPFNKFYITGKEQEYIAQTINRKISGSGEFTKKCCKWLEALTGAKRVLLTNSCTAALEMAAILIDIQPGDEVILPSFTFVSTANAFLLRGAKPVFIDINENDLNIDVEMIEKAITKNTKAIIPVHYAGKSCDMERIVQLARLYDLYVVEDSAHSLMSFQNGKHIGNKGDLSTFSFHETKNISCGEGGALIINNPKLIERAEIILEKGTNRRHFLNNKTSFYTWIDIGSSYLASEISAAFLWAQLEESEKITSKRLKIFNKYRKSFNTLEVEGKVIFQKLNKNSKVNAHIFYILLENKCLQEKFINYMGDNNIKCTSHYIPLHNSPYGSKISKLGSSLEVTESICNRIVRFPLWVGLDNYQDYIIQKAMDFFIMKI